MKNRITIVETVYYEADGQDPVSWNLNSYRPVENPEQAYQRKVKVGEDWIPVDFGWITVPGLVILQHDRPTYSVLPTSEQREEDLARLIQVRTSPQEEGWLIPVGESFRGFPKDPKTLQIRCLSGQSRCTLTILPR